MPSRPKEPVAVRALMPVPKTLSEALAMLERAKNKQELRHILDLVHEFKLMNPFGSTK